jgi:hypothetical protein
LVGYIRKKEIIAQTDMYSTKIRIINIALCVIAIGVIAFYNFCGGTCSYLKGAIFGIDLKYAGIFYMVVLIALNILKWDFIVLPSVSIALGVEAYLVGFQISYWTFCPFCLGFGIIVIGQFILNFKWSNKWYMFAGAIIGLLFFVIFFKGSVVPTYDLSSLNIQYFCLDC